MARSIVSAVGHTQVVSTVANHESEEVTAAIKCVTVAACSVYMTVPSKTGESRMASYTCDQCGMSVDMTCGKCGAALVNDTPTKDDHPTVPVAHFPHGYGMIHSPTRWAQDTVSGGYSDLPVSSLSR